MKTLNSIKMWWIRTFMIISNERAKKLGLAHWVNVYGDRINHLNCRSIWIDNKGHEYRVEGLETIS